MKLTRKLLCLLLALAMILPMIPAVARAEEIPGEAQTDRIVDQVPEEETDEEFPETGNNRIEIPFQINPLYEGLVNEADLEIPEIPEPDEIVTHAATFQSEENAAKTIRSNMKNRAETYTVYVYSTNSDYNALFLELLNNAVVHTGVGTEGDYLMWHLAGWGGEVEIARSGQGYNYTYTYVTPYYTTAEQEQEVTTAVNNLINSLGIKNKSNYEKVCAVYDWICANVTYDHANLEDSSYTLKFSAYAAMINKTAVCQGYALLFYRIMLELGVDTRFIGGDGGGPHAWNIVKLGRYYYNVDATWDAGYTDYEYFLKSTWTFYGHSRDPEFDYWEFHMDHPMAAEDYVHGGTATLDPYISMGYCGTEENGYLNAVWAMMRDGTLMIAGEGAMHDFSTDMLPYYYYWADHIEKVEIAEGITIVGDYCFYKAPVLKEVSFPAGLQLIGDCAFAQCYNLENFELPAGLKTLRSNCFASCPKLTTVIVPEGVETIMTNAFRECTGLTAVVLPSTLKYLSGFNQCTNLAVINIPEGVETIGKNAFYDCKSLQGEIILQNVSVIEESAFLGCVGLTNVVLADQLKKIGNDAFRACAGLTSFEIPDSVTSLGSGVFDTCTALKTVKLSASLTKIPNRTFKLCKNLESFTVPEGITSIGYEAFSYCYALEEITFSDTLTKIDKHAFYRCTALNNIVIPESIRELGYGCFSECTALQKITFMGDAPKFDFYVFDDVVADAYYPRGNDTWTEKVMQDYGGDITWVSMAPPCTDHTYEAVITEPTCQEQGYTTYTCTNCGHSYVGDYTDPVDHVYEDGCCKWCDEELTIVEWVAANATLTGSIDLNFSVVLSDNLVNDGTFVRFTCGNKTVDVPIADAVASVKDGQTRYRFGYKVYAKEMTQTVTAQVMTPNGPVGEAKSYSVAEYCNALMAATDNEEIIAVCKAMLNYGAAAQMQFSYNLDNLANASLSEEDKIVAKPDASAYAHQIVGTGDGIKAASAKLTLDADVAIRVTFQITGGKDVSEYQFLIDGEEAAPVADNGRYYIQLDGIAASKFDETHIFSVGDLAVHYSVLSYVNMVHKSNSPETLVNLINALYAYYAATEAYVN